mgnify:CR=1 FL=1
MKNNKSKTWIFLFISIFLFQSLLYSQDIKSASGKFCSVKIMGQINSKDKKNNVTGVVMGDIFNSDNEIVIKSGSPVILTVNNKRARGMGKPGIIDITTVSTIDINGEPIPLMGNLNLKGDNKRGAALGLGLGLGLTVLFPVGFLFLCVKGENIDLPSNTIIVAVVQ